MFKDLIAAIERNTIGYYSVQIVSVTTMEKAMVVAYRAHDNKSEEYVDRVAIVDYNLVVRNNIFADRR